MRYDKSIAGVRFLETNCFLEIGIEASSTSDPSPGSDVSEEILEFDVTQTHEAVHLKRQVSSIKTISDFFRDLEISRKSCGWVVDQENILEHELWEIEDGSFLSSGKVGIIEIAGVVT